MNSGELPTRDRHGRRIIRVPEVLLIDLDRLAIDTERVFKVAVDATAANTSLTSNQLQKKYEETLASGVSFNFVGFINNSLKETEYTWRQHIEADFIRRSLRQDLLMKGTRKILEYARDNNIFTAIHTFGSSSPHRAGDEWVEAERGQFAKILANGWGDMPYYIANEQHKGTTVTSWEMKDGLHLPRTMCREPNTQVVADRAILMDDKIKSFKGMNERLLGIQVTPEDKANRRAYQQGKLMEGVVAVDGNIEALGALKLAIMLGRQTHDRGKR